MIHKKITKTPLDCPETIPNINLNVLPQTCVINVYALSNLSKLNAIVSKQFPQILLTIYSEEILIV